MIEKDDWRLTGGEEQYVRNQIFQKIRFPEFWHESFKVKNHFYQKIIKDAQKFVKEHKRGEEYLEGEKVQVFWHEHCFFVGKNLRQINLPNVFAHKILVLGYVKLVLMILKKSLISNYWTKPKIKSIVKSIAHYTSHTKLVGY